MNELTTAERAELEKLRRGKELQDLGIDLGLDQRKMSKEEYQQTAAVKLIQNKYDIVRVVSGEMYYYKEHDVTSSTYKHLSDRMIKNLVRWAYQYLDIPVTARKVETTSATLKECVEEEVDNIDTNVIEICDGMYWDGHISDLTDVPSKPCFIRLFDNTGFESPSTINVDMPESYSNIIKGYYKNTLKWLEIMDGELPDPGDEDTIRENEKDYPIPVTFPFIWTWACENHGVYMDMLKMVASVFMKKKPMGAFILTGLRRNGKSTMVKMIHTLLGRANTSSVRLSELSDAHKNLTLSTTLFNAPDEETEGKDMDADAIANFKTMAAHEPLLLPVLYETKPQWVQTNFVSVSPMNSEPEWKGSSASACMQRSLIIQFHADLSKFDNSGKDFARETFTADMYTQLLGVVLAMAKYYKDKPITFSEEMDEARTIISEQVDNKVQYADLFNKWFIGYVDKEDVYADYRAWCKMHAGQFSTMKDLMFAIQERGKGKSRTKLSRDWSDGNINAYRLGPPRKGAYFMPKEEIYELNKTVGDILYIEDGYGNREATGNSVVQCLEDWVAQRQIKEAKDGE